MAVLIQFAASLAAIGLMVALAAWLGRPRPTPPLTRERAAAILAEEYPDDALSALWLSADGRAAIARSGARALILYRLGDGYVARATPWTNAVAAKARDGQLVLNLGD